MKLRDLTKEQLKVLKEWGESPSFKILFELVKDEKIEDAMEIGRYSLTVKDSFELTKLVFEKTFKTKGKGELLGIAKLAENQLKLSDGKRFKMLTV